MKCPKCGNKLKYYKKTNTWRCIYEKEPFSDKEVQEFNALNKKEV